MTKDLPPDFNFSDEGPPDPSYQTDVAQPPARIETGSLQFGTDWPGTFIRGDESFHYRIQLETLVAGTEETAENMIALSAAKSLIQLLASSEVGKGTPVQLKPLAVCLKKSSR